MTYVAEAGEFTRDTHYIGTSFAKATRCGSPHFGAEDSAAETESAGQRAPGMILIRQHALAWATDGY